MKRFVLIASALVIMAMATVWAQPQEVPELPKAAAEKPKLSDADRLSLMTLQRDLNAALLKLSETAKQCPTIDSDRKAALSRRDALQALVDKLAPKGPSTYVLDLDRAQYIERKPEPKKP